MSRNSGCPFNIRDYSVKIKNQVTGEYARVKGLNSMSVDVEADAEDGRSGDSLWAEMFVKSRGVSGSLKGRPIVDRVTGAWDPGQGLLHRAAFNDGGCDNDQTLLVADAVGSAVEYDCVVTKEAHGADEDGETVSWEWKGVGRPREAAYVQATGLSFYSGGSRVTALTVPAGSTREAQVVFAPADASNQRYSYAMGDESVAQVWAIDGQDISIRGQRAGSTTLTLRSMNNALTATLAVTVTA